MSFRTRLIVAFFLVSVVPLTAVTYVSYRSNAAALRDVAEHEADLLAGDLSQRMQMVTAQLRERVEHLMDVSQLEAEVDAAAARVSSVVSVQAQTQTAELVPAMDQQQVASSLGDAAMLLNNVRLRGLNRGGRRSGGGGRGEPGIDPVGGRGDLGGGDPARGSRPPRPEGARGQNAPLDGRPRPPADASEPPQAGDQLMIDLGPVRQKLLQELVPDGQFGALTPEERASLGRELNARMMGIAEGLRLGATELQKRAEAAAAAPALPSAVSVPPASTPVTTPAAPVVRMRSALTGSTLGVTVERDGEILQELSAEINIPNILSTVFSTTHRDRGEVPFAIDPSGQIHTPMPADHAIIESLGPVATIDGPTNARVGDWIVVATPDPTGVGLRLGIARPVGDSLAELRRTSALNLGLGLGFIVVALVGIVPLSGRMTRDLSALGHGVRRIAKGDYATRVPVRSKDEVGQLATAFNVMAEDIERHQRAAIGQERIKRELELGRQIQNDMLPREPLRLGLTEVRGVSVPAREVGGDFFNYFELPDGRIALLVGDVSGKGVGAALLMANIQASLRTRLAMGQGLSDVVNAIDHDVEVDSPGPTYSTLFVGIFDRVTRELRYVNAGHNPQYVLRRDGSIEGLRSTGLPVGMLAGRGYLESGVQLVAGDLLFFYTDGCVEAENSAGEMFGADQLEALLAQRFEGANDVLTRVEASVKAFRGSQEASDDATMMAVQVG